MTIIQKLIVIFNLKILLMKITYSIQISSQLHDIHIHNRNNIIQTMISEWVMGVVRPIISEKGEFSFCSGVIFVKSNLTMVLKVELRETSSSLDKPLAWFKQLNRSSNSVVVFSKSLTILAHMKFIPHKPRGRSPKWALFVDQCSSRVVEIGYSDHCLPTTFGEFYYDEAFPYSCRVWSPHFLSIYSN